MPQKSLLPAIRDILESIRMKKRVDEVLGLILEKACYLADGVHGSFVLIDEESGKLSISQVFGSDWTLEKRLCQLSLGEGLTGKVAATGKPLLCSDTSDDPSYYPLFDYVRSELVVPVFVKNRVWGVINIDGPTPHAFDQETLDLLTVFAELAAFAITMRLEIGDQDRLYQKLLQSEKLASMGQALAGIAHEINNPLTSILCYASLLQMEGSAQGSPEALDVIVSESQRAAGLIKSLLEFSRKETGRREWVDLNKIVRQVSELKRIQMRMSKVKLIVSCEEQPCRVHVCPEQIKQVLLNLLNNAEQAIPEDRQNGMVHVDVAQSKDRAQIVVTDNGSGMSPDVRAKIFDPFFTTKGPDKGTGLGLSVSFAIMEAHRGEIRLANSSPAGTSFVLELPIATAQDRREIVIRPADEPSRLGGRVLLLDDEPLILEALSAYLGTKHIAVQHVSDPRRALEMLNQHSYDVVVSDVRMPGMDGLEFYEAAQQIDPRYARRFIFMSGYLMRENIRAFMEMSDVPCLEKPFSFDELQRTIKPFLNGGKTPPELFAANCA